MGNKEGTYKMHACYTLCSSIKIQESDNGSITTGPNCSLATHLGNDSLVSLCSELRHFKTFSWQSIL